MNVCFNGAFYPLDTPILTAGNRSFKWGDGLFETMKVHKGKVLLEDLHFERLHTGLELLKLKRNSGFTQSSIVQKILELCAKNNCLPSARVRLAVFRSNDDWIGYVIEATPLDEKVNEWSEKGLMLCLYPHARKSTDAFANIKSANFLPYVLAQKFAEENKVDDAIVLNGQNHVSDTSRANIFLVKRGEIFTPALHQGCVSGVMRRLVIDRLKQVGYPVHQEEVSEEQLLNADEVFLTNAIQIIRWVKQYKTAQYRFDQTKQIFTAVTETIFTR